MGRLVRFLDPDRDTGQANSFAATSNRFLPEYASFVAGPSPLKGFLSALGMNKNILTRPPDAGARYPQVRATPRYRLVAQAEIYEPLSRTRLQARTTEIGANGCYVDVTG